MAFSDDKKSPIERMRRSLYERKTKTDIDPRHIVHEQTNDVVVKIGKTTSGFMKKR